MIYHVTISIVIYYYLVLNIFVINYENMGYSKNVIYPYILLPNLNLEYRNQFFI